MVRVAFASFAVLLCVACTNSMSVRQDAEIVSSIRYDSVPCAELLAERNALAASQDLPRDTRREALPEGSPNLGLVIPDTRSEAESRHDQAVALLSAMNESMERRECGET